MHFRKQLNKIRQLYEWIKMVAKMKQDLKGE